MKNNFLEIQLSDIVLAPFPFADNSVTKLRPAIIVSKLPNNAWLVIYITSNLENQTTYDVRIEPNTTNNLKITSIARVNRLTVISNNMIKKKLGTLCKTELKSVRSKLEQIASEFTKNNTMC